MATENQNLQFRKIARLPDTAKPADIDLTPMKAIVFFVLLDRLGRRLAYSTVLFPLIATALIVKKVFRETTPEMPKKMDPENELFTPYGP